MKKNVCRKNNFLEGLCFGRRISDNDRVIKIGGQIEVTYLSTTNK